MVVSIVVIARLVEPIEAPAIELTREGFILALDEVLWNHLADKEFLVMDLPCSAVWHPRNDMRVFVHT